MSAAQRMGRICPDCHLELVGLTPGTVRHRHCQAARKLALKKAKRNELRASGLYVPRPPKPEHKSVQPRENYVRADAMRVPNVLCKECCGMSWVRRVGLYSEVKGAPPLKGCGVMGPDGVVRCKACGDEYAPEPRPEPASALVSSAGMAARHGQLHGVNGACSGRPSRKQFS